MHVAKRARCDDPDRALMTSGDVIRRSVLYTGLRAVLVAAAVATSATPARAASALAAVAPEIARGLGSVPANSVVVVSPLVSEVAAPRGDELAVRLASLVAGQLGNTVAVHGRAEPFSVAQALGAKGGGLVYVQVEIARGQLRASADLYPVPSNGWDRVRVPLPAPRAHAFASAPLDAEVRGYLPPLAIDHAAVKKARHDFGDVLAVSCGDVDGDGINDIVLVTRTTVAWGHVASGRFVATHAVAWSALGPRVPVPMREPLATSAVVPRSDGTGGDLLVGTTDRGGVALSRDLRGAAPLHGLPLLSGRTAACVRPSPAAGAFEGNLFACADPGHALLGAPVARYDAVSTMDLVGRDGASRPVLIVREPSGTLKLRIGDKPGGPGGIAPVEESLGSVGAQLAVGDLDQDGIAEVVTTTESGADAITIASWRGSELVTRTKIPAPGAVRALAVCPPEDAGPSALVAVVAGEVWVVR
jgi:hypothetical protein